MTNTDRARKLLVRTALVTSTTIATLIGAQNFAMLDLRNLQTEEADRTAEPDDVAVVIPTAIHTSVPVERAAPEITILHIAPSITILRQSGQVNTTQSTTASVAPIQPPAPSQITAPNPVVVPQPVPQNSHSSR